MPPAISPISNTLENLPTQDVAAKKKKQKTKKPWNSIFLSTMRREHRTFCEVNKERKTFTQQIAGFSPKDPFTSPKDKRWAGKTR